MTTTIYHELDPDAVRAAVEAADVPDYDRATHPLGHLSSSRRIDATLAILSALPVREGGEGFSAGDIADIAGVTRQAIYDRLQRAESRVLDRLRALLGPDELAHLRATSRQRGGVA